MIHGPLNIKFTVHINIFYKHIALFSGKQIDLCSSGIVVRHTYVYKESIVKYQREKKKIYIYLFIQNIQHKGVPYFASPFEQKMLFQPVTDHQPLHSHERVSVCRPIRL
jgi:hypothetical protein